MKFCPRLLIFELLDCTLGTFRGMILAFLKYCYFWIDILGFLIQTFESAYFLGLKFFIFWGFGKDFLTLLGLKIFNFIFLG